MTDPTRDPDGTTPSADGGSAAPDAGTGPAAGGPAVDLGRRRFFRTFAGELIQTAVTLAGAAQALQQVSAQAAGAILEPGRGGGAARAGR